MTSSSSLRKHKLWVGLLLFGYFAVGYGLMAALNEHTAHPIQATTWLDNAIPLWPIFIRPLAKITVRQFRGCKWLQSS